MSNFESKIIKALENKDLSETSIKFYLRNMRLLNDNEPISNLKFLDDTKNILDKISDLKPNTRRNYIISICSVLNSMGKTKSKTYKKYFEDLKEYNKTLKEQEAKNEKTDTQKENWLEWDDIVDKHNELKKEVDSFKNKDEITPSQYNVLLKYVILSLYVLLPPRRNEYLNMYIVKKYKMNFPKYKNYISFEDEKFIFNQYKTAKKEGEIEIEIPDELWDILKIYFKFHPNLENINKDTDEPFLVDYKGEEFKSNNSITRILNSIFKPKKISSSMLRHIFISHKFGNVNKEQQDIAKKMSHSVSMQKDYIKN